MERSHLTLSIHNLIQRGEAFSGYNNYGMDPSTPVSPGSEFVSGTYIQDSLSPGFDSDFDESLAVPESLSVINYNSKKPEQITEEDEVDNSVPLATCCPFKAYHSPPVKFKSTQRKVFIPGVEIKVRFTENERSATTHLIYPNLYTITLKHGDYTWTIKKRYKHILYLHQQLRLYRATVNIPFPTKSHKERRASFKNTVRTATEAENNAMDATKVRKKEGRYKKRKGALPRFPSKPEVMIPYDGIILRMKQLEDYIYNLLNITIYRNHHETVSFLEVSHLSFISELGEKGKEGMIEKRTGSTQPGQAGCNCFGFLHTTVCVRCNYFCTVMLCAKWQKRWFFVKDTCFGYIRPTDGVVKSVMLFDQGFEVSSGMYSTGLNKGLQILNMSRQMVIKCWTRRKSKEWMLYLKNVANTTAREFTSPNVHHSFAPVRPNTSVIPLVDASIYLSAVADAMEAAKEEIFIADWWLSPEIYLKRPALSGDYWRLDQVLRRKAVQGVKIFVLLYKEVEMALGINSYYSKSRLAGDNIKVFRHPDHAKAGILFWAHHEKIVCVDQSIAFLGGIDLCYGRWDDHKHRLTDLGCISRMHTSTVKTKKKTSSSPGGGVFYVPQLKIFTEKDEKAEAALNAFNKELTEDMVEAESQVTQSEEVTGSESDSTKGDPGETKPNGETDDLPILDPGDSLLMPQALTAKFSIDEQTDTPDTGRRKVINKITERGKDIISLIYPTYDPDNDHFEESERKKAEKYAASTDQIISMETETGEKEVKMLPKGGKTTPLAEIVKGKVVTAHGKGEPLEEMSNCKLWLGKDYTNFIVKDFINLDSPFTDLVDRNSTPRMPWHDVGLAVDGAAARDVARHFVQRWNAVKLEKFRQNVSYPYLLPKSYKQFKTRPDLDTIIENNKYSVSCQVLRSVSSWSCGFIEPDTLEQSIHEAYVDTITKAQHYIYIENQFFITLSMSNGSVRNQIGEALFNRILRAYRAGEVFRVYVVMPLLPGFEGEVGAASGTSLHAVTHWNYQSISRGKQSLLVRLAEAGIKNPSEYVTFHGLRTHSILDGEPITELIYVHSKLLISDDKIVICGSANINDRSMLGKRDSEIAVILQDETFDEGFMNGKAYPSGRFAGALRKRLFEEHLGIMGRTIAEHGVDISDPCIETFYHDTWIATSKFNTAIYEQVFHCIPCDQVKSFASLKKYQEENANTLWHTNPALANAKIDEICGYIVDLPLDFLVNEVLTPPNNTVEGMLPTSLWT